MLIGALILAQITGCQAWRDDPADTSTSKSADPVTPPIGEDRSMRPPCAFTQRIASTLSEVPDASDFSNRWPLSTTLTWHEPTSAWLGAEVEHETTDVTVELVDDSVATIVIHSPASGAPEICKPRVEFDAQLRVHTRYGLVDATAKQDRIAKSTTVSPA
jgi:hypothetical protein